MRRLPFADHALAAVAVELGEEAALFQIGEDRGGLLVEWAGFPIAFVVGVEVSEHGHCDGV